MAQSSDPTAPRTDPLAGTRYRTIRTLAQGRTGTVVEAEHIELRSHVAVKLLAEHVAYDPALVDRLRVEARVLGRLAHPNLVEVTNFERTPDGRAFMVMELLAGRTLQRELEARRALPLLEAIGYVVALLDVLGAAHLHGVVHRDVSLDNVFLHESPNGRIVKLLDFGVAKILDEAERVGIRRPVLPTEQGAQMATAEFAAPELSEGGPVDGRADIYATGILLYTLIAGRGPWDQSAQATGARRAQLYSPAPLSGRTREPVPAALESAIQRALEPDPNRRFASASAFSAELRKVEQALRDSVSRANTEFFSPPDFGAVRPATPAREWVPPAADGARRSGVSQDSIPTRTADVVIDEQDLLQASPNQAEPRGQEPQPVPQAAPRITGVTLAIIFGVTALVAIAIFAGVLKLIL